MIKNRLKEIRMREYMLNQKDFAALLGIDSKKYNRYENGDVPSSEMMLKIAKKIDIKVEDIFHLSDD